MKFNYIRIYESFHKQVYPHFYAGYGVNIDDHRSIIDQSLKLDTPNQVVTSNYFYSKKYGFDHFYAESIKIH